MPWVKGESLREKLHRETQLRVDEAVAIIRQAASALDHAHAQGLVHRDIKPENILLHEGEAMVADFGIALAPAEWRGDRTTSAGLALGTPAYMTRAGGGRACLTRDVTLACVSHELRASRSLAHPQSVMSSGSPARLPSAACAVPAAAEQALLRVSPVPPIGSPCGALPTRW
jgi:serine/threonine-protein kinase